MPILDLGLENKSPRRFHFFAQLRVRSSRSDGTTEIILISISTDIRIRGACSQRMQFMTGRSRISLINILFQSKYQAQKHDIKNKYQV